MKYCPYCGEKIEESYQHCPYCGANLRADQVAEYMGQGEDDEEIGEDELIYILTNDDSPIVMAAKPVPIQKDLLHAIGDACKGITPEPTGDLMIDGINREIPDLLATFAETVYEPDYEDYSVKEECRNRIYDGILSEMENDKQQYPCIETGKKRLKKANLTRKNFAALYSLRGCAYTGDKIQTKDSSAGEHADVNYLMLIKYIRAIAMREACKSIKQIDLKLKAACYWYTYFSSEEFGLKEYQADMEGAHYSTTTVVKSTGEPIRYCIQRNDALYEISKETFEATLRGEKDNNAYTIGENEANQLITNAWENIGIYATEKLEDTVPNK